MKLTWTPQPRAACYRVLLRDIGEARFSLKSDPLAEPAFELDDEQLEAGHHYEWRPQWQEGQPEGEWHDVHPPLHVLSPRADPARLSRLSWEHDPEELYRVIIRDEGVDAVVVKHTVRGGEYLVDWSVLDALHPLRWRVQRWAGGQWVELTAYQPLSPPLHALVSGRRDRPPEPLDLDQPEQLLFLFTVDTEGALRLMADPDPRRVYEQHVFGDLGDGRGMGIGLHMDVAERYGFRCCFFLDILMELQFGREGMERTIEAIASRGHEIQLHLHSSQLTAGGHRDRALIGALYGNDPEPFRRALAFAVELFEARVGRPPVAYRSGGYNLHESFLPVLAEFGITIDSSMNAFKNCRVPEWMRSRTQPFLHGGVLEVPVSWQLREGRDDGDVAARQLSPFTSERQEGFTHQPTAGRAHPLTAVYVSHSYQLMASRHLSGPAARERWLARLAGNTTAQFASSHRNYGGDAWELLEGRIDEDRMTLLHRTLAQLAARTDVRGATFQQLHDAGIGRWRGRDSEPADPVPVWSGRANRATTRGLQTYSRALLESLETAADAAPPAPGADPLLDLLDRSAVEWRAKRVLLWAPANCAAAAWLDARGARVTHLDGDLRGALPDDFERFDTVVASALERLPPETLLESLRCCHERLEPGGCLIARAETFFSDAGGRVEGLRTPGAHILFSEPVLAELPGASFAEGSAFCAATYMTAFRRAGFEFADLRRLLRAVDDPFLARWALKLRFYDPLERRTTALEATLRRPVASDLRDLRLVAKEAS